MPITLDPQTETDRVRRYTSAEMLREIEKQIEENIAFYSVQPLPVISRRIDDLRREWSIERYLQVNVSTAGLLTGVLALTSSRKWAILTCGALGFFLFHALRGFDPPIPLLRKMGIRTRSEIDREIFALKAVRGDFKTSPVQAPPGPQVAPGEVLRAVSST